MAKLLGLPKGISMTNPSQLWFTIARAAKIGATKIHHKCGYCATIFQSDKIAAVARLIQALFGRRQVGFQECREAAIPSARAML
jgi:hypothetical protein